MVITVKLFAHFRHGRFKEDVRPWREGTRCGDIVHELGLRAGELGIVMVNGEHAPLDQTLEPRDVLAIFPLVGGG